jgi:phage/plasmid-associated DNA primase
MLLPVLNEDPDDKAELMTVITNWLGDEKEEALSLLRHLATTLAPHWSAGKYVLLIGDGRNGKSLMMTMLQDLFGHHNCSGVERQEISVGSPGAFDLNGKLLNLVFDGPAEFVKDSGKEKTVITGEQIKVRKLYANEQSVIQTNALFVEGLNQEPRSKDKSSALQARLVRFWFPNKYAEDDMFFTRMRSPRMLGALLSLLIDHYVMPESKGIMLAPTRASRQLQMEHMEDNSIAMQFILHVDETDPLGAAVLIDEPFDTVVQRFKSWRLNLDDLTVWDKATLLNTFRPVLHTSRKSIRSSGHSGPYKIRVISGFKQDTLELLASVKEEDNATPMVED